MVYMTYIYRKLHIHTVAKIKAEKVCSFFPNPKYQRILEKEFQEAKGSFLQFYFHLNVVARDPDLQLSNTSVELLENVNTKIFNGDCRESGNTFFFGPALI